MHIFHARRRGVSHTFEFPDESEVGTMGSTIHPHTSLLGAMLGKGSPSYRSFVLSAGGTGIGEDSPSISSKVVRVWP